MILLGKKILFSVYLFELRSALRQDGWMDGCEDACMAFLCVNVCERERERISSLEMKR